jgi:hypothetical protein
MKQPANIKPKTVLSSDTLLDEKIRHSYLLTLCSKTALGDSYVLLQSAQSNEVFRFPDLATAFDFLNNLAQPIGKTLGVDP